VPVGSEADAVPVGSVVDTPMGQFSKDPVTGEGKVKLNPAGQEAYRRRFVKSMESFGAFPLSDDSGAPRPTLTPGKKFYNPFTNTWGDA
jgi:hypothetical protein